MPDLPSPVLRYLRRALPERALSGGGPFIESATLQQRGELRMSAASPEWFAFTATERISLDPPSFAWDARVRLPLGVRLRLRDGYAAGIGEARMSILGLTLSHERGRAELNQGALLRYLAEAPWYPWALLPRPGLSWSPLDNRRALAMLEDHANTVALEFRFDENGDVGGIYSATRWDRVRGAYRRAKWEGHFSRYEFRYGVRVPSYGEVGWYGTPRWEPVWRGSLVSAQYRFAGA